MILSTIKSANDEFEADGVRYKIVISHIPFTFKRNSPFDIEKPLYSSWAKLIREKIKPDFMLCGHTHTACISRRGDEHDELGNPCTVVVGSDVTPDKNDELVLGGALITLNDGFADVRVNTQNGILLEDRVDF